MCSTLARFDTTFWRFLLQSTHHSNSCSTTTLLEGFSRLQRLTQASDYAFVFAQACKCSNKHLTMLCRDNNRDTARLGLAIAKKQIRHACGRNRVKRLIRESFRLQQQRLSGLDIVVLARSSIMKQTNQQILNHLDILWQQLSKRCKNSC